MNLRSDLGVRDKYKHAFHCVPPEESQKLIHFRLPNYAIYCKMPRKALSLHLEARELARMKWGLDEKL